MTSSTKLPKTLATTAPQAELPVAGKHRRWWHVAAEAAALFVVAIAGLELVMNACGVGLEEILQPDPVMGVVHIPNKRVVWRMEGYSDDKFSSAGLRDVEHAIPKPADTFRIVLLGDSATEGLQVPMANTYASFLQANYKVPGKEVEVLNFGCSSYSTGQEVLQFERQAAQYKPDLTIALYNRGDALENVRKPGDLNCEPRPYFYMNQAGMLVQDDAVLQANALALKPNPIADFLRVNSRLYGVFTHANLTMSLNEPLYRKLRGWILAPFNKKRPKVDDAVNLTDSRVPQDINKVTAALLQRLNADCRKAGGKLVVIDFPNSVNDPEYGKQISMISKTAKSTGFGVFDLSPKFAMYPNPKELFVKFHFSTKGHDFVAHRIIEHLNGVDEYGHHMNQFGELETSTRAE